MANGVGGVIGLHVHKHVKVGQEEEHDSVIHPCQTMVEDPVRDILKK